MARIIVVGGSLGGLLAASLLLRDGHDVLLLEKAREPLDGRGAGIVTHHALHVALGRAGVAVDASLGVAVTTRIVLDSAGETTASMPLPQLLTSWGRLYTLLSALLPADRSRRGSAVQRVETAGERAIVTTAHGQLDADLVIASDGLRSAVRAQLAPAALPRYAGYVAWRGVCDEAVLSDRARATMFERFAFGLPEGEQLIGYPVAGAGNTTERGARRYNFVWYRPAPAGDALDRLLTDADGVLHPLGIPPQRVSWREIAAMREHARAVLAPQFAEVIEKTALPFLQPIHDVASDRIAFGRVALMGDAAFVARPHVGMGVTKAAEDAIAIADAIRMLGATPAALLDYEAARLPAGRAIVERSRRLGAYLEGRQRDRDAQSVLRETAVAPDLLPLPKAA